MSRTPAGFTLIELLVVIAIIAILAAILFPVFAQAKSQAKKSNGVSNVKQIALAGVMYANDNDDVTVPMFYFDPTDLHLPSTFGFYYWDVQLLPYTKNEKIYIDLMDTDDDPSLSDGTHGRFDPNNMFHYYILGESPSYGYNLTYLNNFVPDPANPNGLGFYYSGVSETSLPNVAQTVQFAESTSKDLVDYQSGQVITGDFGYAGIFPPSQWDTTVTFPNARSQGQLWGRYDKKHVIVGWLDGHIKYSTIDSLVGPNDTVAHHDKFWNGQS
ncbi:MAG TPA: prepilin-type N-terminal cleavage/methylation domain-containing protein [Fimbriimonadaceae bacterium]|nr:prepilin-type N-terminal cleavage/methylation domain-containing protein [Fimbriimonadaceae bacterium]